MDVDFINIRWSAAEQCTILTAIDVELEVVLLRRGHSDWSASSGQPSYYFLWPAASGRARSECDIVLICLC